MAGGLREVTGKDRAAHRVEFDLAHTAHAQPDKGEVEAADAGKQRQERHRMGPVSGHVGAHVLHPVAVVAEPIGGDVSIGIVAFS